MCLIKNNIVEMIDLHFLFPAEKSNPKTNHAQYLEIGAKNVMPMPGAQIRLCLALTRNGPAEFPRQKIMSSISLIVMLFWCFAVFAVAMAIEILHVAA